MARTTVRETSYTVPSPSDNRLLKKSRLTKANIRKDYLIRVDSVSRNIFCCSRIQLHGDIENRVIPENCFNFSVVASYLLVMFRNRTKVFTIVIKYTIQIVYMILYRVVFRLSIVGAFAMSISSAILILLSEGSNGIAGVVLSFEVHVIQVSKSCINIRIVTKVRVNVALSRRDFAK